MSGAGRPSGSLRPVLALCLATFLWSGNFVVGRALRDAVDPVTLSTLRWSLCLLFLLPLIWRRLTAARRAAMRRSWRLLLALGATGIAGFQTFVYLAVSRTTAVNALLMLAITPALIMLGAAVTGQGRPRPVQWLGCLVSLGGAVVLISHGDLAALARLRLNAGDLWMLGAVIAWCIYSLMLRRRPADLPQDLTLAGSILGGLAILLPLLMADLPAARLALGPEVVAGLLYVSICASLVAFLLWSFGVEAIGAARAGQFVYLMPVFGTALAVLFLGERVTPTQLAGAACICVGILLVNRVPATATSG